jgi:adenylate cyclase
LSIGVHFGPVVVGDVGTKDRLEIAVLGNTVNVASRLEGATRDVGCHSLISKDLVMACELENTQAGAKLLELLSHEHFINLKGVDQLCGAFELKEPSSGRSM